MRTIIRAFGSFSLLKAHYGKNIIIADDSGSMTLCEIQNDRRLVKHPRIEKKKRNNKRYFSDNFIFML